MKRSLVDADLEKLSQEESNQRSFWTAEEDKKLFEAGVIFKGKHWKSVANEVSKATLKDGKAKTAKQCRERWHNTLNPDVKVGPWNGSQEIQLFYLHKIHGNKWSEIAKRLPGRTDNAIKNFFFCKLRRLVRNIKDSSIDIDSQSLPYEIEHTFYLLDYLYKFYISPERNENIRRSLSSQIKGRKNFGDKYITDIISQESITAITFEKYLRLLLASLPSQIAQPALKNCTELLLILSSHSNEFSYKMDNPSLHQLPSLPKRVHSSSASCISY
jgi:hypothetical protein